MKIDILVDNDDFFKFETINSGELPVEQFIKEEEKQPEQEIIVPEVQTNAAPLENSRRGHPFDPFGGTSWEGKRQAF